MAEETETIADYTWFAVFQGSSTVALTLPSDGDKPKALHARLSGLGVPYSTFMLNFTMKLWPI
jgi:hypothetical protein